MHVHMEVGEQDPNIWSSINHSIISISFPNRFLTMKYSCLLHHCMAFNYTGGVTDEYGLHMIHVTVYTCRPSATDK